MDENNELFHHITPELVNEGFQLIEKAVSDKAAADVAEKEIDIMAGAQEFNQITAQATIDVAPMAVKVARGIVPPQRLTSEMASYLAIAFRAGVYCGRKTSALKSKKD